jgi:pimeloyl-ACP methyl ester carboxylesterase
LQLLSSALDLLTPSVELPTGVTLNYLEQGSPSGVPVLLLHGLTDSMRSYEPVLAHLPASIRAFALSERGHGDSSHPLSGYRPADFAADLAAFLDACGLERAVVVGHSMSSYVAQRFALDYPERTLGLVLLGAFATTAGNPVWLELAQAGAELAGSIDAGFAADFQQSTLARPVPKVFFDIVVQESMKMPVGAFRAAIRDFVESDHRARLGEIQAPTLIVWGDQDTYFPWPEQDALLAAIAGSELQIYAGAGHALHWEEPARFAADLAAFVEKLG